jgi:hypothetical protein
LHAPGTDFNTTLQSIFFLRNCLEHPSIKNFVTFHLYFEKSYLIVSIPKDPEELEKMYSCPKYAPYENKTSSDLFKTKHKLQYPINVGRNLAKRNSLTHFILASDVELFPNPGLIRQFLTMIAKNTSLIEEQN